MHKIPYLEPIPDDKPFPADPALPEGARSLHLTPDPGLRVLYLPDVVYAQQDGEKQHLHILLPQSTPPDPTRLFPLIVYIPGSAFLRQNMAAAVPMLLDFARRGFVIASVQYRPSTLAAFPAQTEDAKTAMRFMRRQAKKYRVDTDKTAYWGASSGGHTAALAGITGDDEPNADLYREHSAAAGCIVDFFGPTAIERMNARPSAMDHVGPDSPEGLLIGGRVVTEHLKLAQAVNPARYLHASKPTPPIFILHGDRDPLVPFEQSVLLYERLRELKKEVEFIKLIDSGHGDGGFDSQACLNLVEAFLRRHLGAGR